MISSVPVTIQCSDFLLDVVAHRVEWIGSDDLLSVAVAAGFSDQHVRATLRRCWHHGLLSRTYCNVAKCDQGCPRYLAHLTNHLVPKLKLVQVKQFAPSMVAEPAEIVGLGIVAAGLLGRVAPVIPDAERLAAALRLTRAFVRYAAGKSNFDGWHFLRSRSLKSVASVATQNDEHGNVQKIVIAPVRMGKRKVVALLKHFECARASYEIW